MSALGLAMFGVAIVLMIATGLPVYAVLLGVAAAFAALGVGLDAFEWRLLTALPSRLVGLLEHNLLQALPLYALIGALLNRLPLAGLMLAAGERLFGRSAASAQLSTLGVGALLAPMNGSVGASLRVPSWRPTITFDKPISGRPILAAADRRSHTVFESSDRHPCLRVGVGAPGSARAPRGSYASDSSSCTACANACGASCGRLCPAPVTTRCS